MPVFTYVASYIVAEIIGVAGAAVLGSAGVAFVTSSIAVGLAVVTSRLINGPGPQGGSGGGAQNQGTRVQLPPNTEYKVPLIYGHAYQRGIITDAHISNANKTMTYVLTLSEKTDTGTWTVGDILWNDQKLVYRADGYTVDSSITSDGSTNTNFSGLIRTWVYAGGTASANQIQGPSTKVNAYDIIPEINSSYQMSDLVFAVVQLDYSAEKGITGLPAMSFELNNSLSDPGLVWKDYMTNVRYGCGFTESNLDLDSVTDLSSLSNTIPSNQYESDGTTTSTQKRYVINGVMNTGDTVKTNLDKINLASASWTTYDHKLGQWRVISNRASTVGELAAAQVFDDDNILGDITVTSTNLESLYNGVEVSFANGRALDQTDYYKANLSAGQLNTLEPVNIMRMSTALCNNGIHAGRIGNIELRQSRIDLIVAFTADYSALQTEAGDIIKLTNAQYGFDNQLFRVTRVRETETEDGGLTAEITALQYDSTVYDDTSLSNFAGKPSSNIPVYGSSTNAPAPSTPVISNQTPSATVPSFDLTTVISSVSGPVSQIQWYYGTNTNASSLLKNISPTGGGNYSPGISVTDTITTLNTGTYYFKARTVVAGNNSPYSSTSTSLSWAPHPINSSNYGSIV